MQRGVVVVEVVVVVVAVAVVVVRRCRRGGSAGVVVGGERWDARGQGMTVVECRGSGTKGCRRTRRGTVEGEEKREREKQRRREGAGKTELATETVIWRPSQNGDVLCHSPRR